MLVEHRATASASRSIEVVLNLDRFRVPGPSDPEGADSAILECGLDPFTSIASREIQLTGESEGRYGLSYTEAIYMFTRQE